MKILNSKTLSLPRRSDLHLLRKLWHIAIGSLAISSYYYFEFHPKKLGLCVLAFSFLAFAFDYCRLNNRRLNYWVCQFMAPFLRRSEVNSFSGLPYYALGCSLSLLLFPEKWAVLSIFFLVFADPFASLFGILYGRDKVFANKSLQGIAASFCICYLITLLYLDRFAGLSLDAVAFAFAAGLVGAASEALTIFNLDDNLTIPILSGAGLTLLAWIIPVI